MAILGEVVWPTWAVPAQFGVVPFGCRRSGLSSFVLGRLHVRGWLFTHWGLQMNDETISLGKCVAAGLWVLVALMIATAWVIAIEGHWLQAMLIAQTGTTLSAMAATRHIRCYFVRLAALVRATAELGDLPPADLRRLPSPRQPV